MGKAVWQAFLEHKVADQNSGAASFDSFSPGKDGKVKNWWRGPERKENSSR